MSKSNSKQKRAKKTQEHETGNLPINNSLGGENIRCGELGSTRQAIKYSRCGELGTTR